MLMNRPLVSILINNYNYGHFLRTAIDSALNQTYDHIEVVVVDDGSTDNSRDIIDSYGNKISVVFKENGGQASAFNAGFAASKGDIICLLDSDDSFHSNKITRIAEIFISDREVGWCFHSLSCAFSDGEEMKEELSHKENRSLGSRSLSLREQMVKKGRLVFHAPATSGLTFRRKLLSDILPMPEATSVTLSDNYIKFTSFLLADGYFLNEKLACQLIHSSNLYTNRKDTHVVKLRAEITILTAYWIRKKHPEAVNFTNILMARGVADIWEQGFFTERTFPLVKEYISSLPFVCKMFILARVAYNRVKI
jgi:glycosyltransferase involved in cell wall biosynthesis